VRREEPFVHHLPSGVEAELVHPQGEHQRDVGVVLVPDAFGLRPLVSDLCAWLAAEQGWTVITSEYRRAGEDGLDDDDVFEDLAAAARATSCSTVVVLGLCLGGHYALKASSLEVFDAAISLYGAIVSKGQKPGNRNLVDYVRRARGPILDIVAGKDAHATPASHIEAFSEIANMPIVVYPASDHGFAHDLTRPPNGWGRRANARPAPWVVPSTGSDAHAAWTRIFDFVRCVESSSSMVTQ
jgi:dienelactone hydrolase